jgi:hypothetical protein
LKQKSLDRKARNRKFEADKSKVGKSEPERKLKCGMVINIS